MRRILAFDAAPGIAVGRVRVDKDHEAVFLRKVEGGLRVLITRRHDEVEARLAIERVVDIRRRGRVERGNDELFRAKVPAVHGARWLFPGVRRNRKQPCRRPCDFRDRGAASDRFTFLVTHASPSAPIQALSLRACMPETIALGKSCRKIRARTHPRALFRKNHPNPFSAEVIPELGACYNPRAFRPQPKPSG